MEQPENSDATQRYNAIYPRDGHQGAWVHELLDDFEDRKECRVEPITSVEVPEDAHVLIIEVPHERHASCSSWTYSQARNIDSSDLHTLVLARIIYNDPDALNRRSYVVRHLGGGGGVIASSPEAAAEAWVAQWGQRLSGEDVDPTTQKFPDTELEQDVVVTDVETGDEYTFTYAVNGLMEYRRVEPAK